MATNRRNRGFERREDGTAIYFKVATWDARSFTFKAGFKTFPTKEEAMATAVKPGRYRLSEVRPDGKTDSDPFEV